MQPRPRVETSRASGPSRRVAIGVTVIALPYGPPATVGTMEFQDVVLRRRMVRDFSDEPVARPLVEQLVANAARIPSAGFSQGVAFVVLTEPGQRRLFWETTSGPEWRGE